MVVAVRLAGGEKVTLRTRAALWAAEVWINLTVAPARLFPHPIRAVRFGDGYRCMRCGSRSARVQRKGHWQAEALRRQLS
jgi:hypothetical protein